MSQEHPSFWIIKRWIPSYLEDILWEHTSQMIAETMEREHGSLSRSPQPETMSPRNESIPRGNMYPHVKYSGIETDQVVRQQNKAVPNTFKRYTSIRRSTRPCSVSQLNNEKVHEKALPPLPPLPLPLQKQPTSHAYNRRDGSSEEAQQQPPPQDPFSLCQDLPAKEDRESFGIIPPFSELSDLQFLYLLTSSAPEKKRSRVEMQSADLEVRDLLRLQMRSEDRVELEVRDLLRRWTFVDPEPLFASANAELRSAPLDTGEGPGGEESRTKRVRVE